MRKLVMAAVAMMLMAVVAAPSAVAQEAEKAAAEKKMEKAEKMERAEKMSKSRWMKGTMTPPDQEAMEIAYEMTRDEHGMKGWIVAEGMEGEKVKIEMKDLSMGADYVSYNWSPPDDANTVISCNLEKQDDGGYAGDCTDSGEEGRTGQMTIAPMEEMNPGTG